MLAHILVMDNIPLCTLGCSVEDGRVLLTGVRRLVTVTSLVPVRMLLECCVDMVIQLIVYLLTSIIIQQWYVSAIIL